MSGRRRPFILLLHFLSFIVLMALAACTSESPTAVSDPNSILIDSRFVSAYEALGGKAVLGDPISIAFTQTIETGAAQYFQNGRLQQTPEGIGMAPLGEWTLEGAGELTPLEAPDGVESRYFSETDQRVSGEFLAFYEAHQGELLLGPPIAPLADEDGRMVQYFRNGRLQFHPELPADQRVSLANLGRAHFETPAVQYAYRTALLARPVPAADVEKVDVFAYLQAPVLYNGEAQSVRITVLSPDGRPVSDMPVTAAITFGDAVTGIVRLGVTDAQGKIQAILPTEQIPPEQNVKVIISAYSPAEDVLGSDSLFFKTWW